MMTDFLLPDEARLAEWLTMRNARWDCSGELGNDGLKMYVLGDGSMVLVMHCARGGYVVFAPVADVRTAAEVADSIGPQYQSRLAPNDLKPLSFLAGYLNGAGEDVCEEARRR